MKQKAVRFPRYRRYVAPYVGAWIETLVADGKNAVISVAPYVGAWIETFHKPLLMPAEEVAPYVGAWIET